MLRTGEQGGLLKRKRQMVRGAVFIKDAVGGE